MIANQFSPADLRRMAILAVICSLTAAERSDAQYSSPSSSVPYQGPAAPASSWSVPLAAAAVPSFTGPSGSASSGNAAYQRPRIHYVPVTEYRYEPRWHGRWNLFATPHVAYHMMPTTRWVALPDPAATAAAMSVAVRANPASEQGPLVPIPGRWPRPVGVAQVAQLPASPAANVAVPYGSTTPAPQIQSWPADQVGGIQVLDTSPPRQGARIVAPELLRR